MALTWDITRCNQEPIDNDDEWVITQTIIWTTLGTGIGDITDQNWTEFYARNHLLEKIHGPTVHKNGKPYPLTPEDIWRRIGLRTNVFPELTRSQWLKQHVTPQLDRIKRNAAMTITDERN